MNFKTLMIERVGDPDDMNYLDLYINHVISKAVPREYVEEYCEDHHLLPRCIFPEFEHDLSNIFRLRYDDHVEAHVILAKCFPNEIQFCYPLLFMKPGLKGEGFNQSEISKMGWKKLKSDVEKYERWLKARKEYSNSEEAKKRSAEILRKTNEKRFSDPNAREDVGDAFRELWKDDDYRTNLLTQWRIMWDDPDWKAKKSEETKQIWERKGPIERKCFTEKMTKLNQCLEKRSRNSKVMKEKWETDEEYKEKMRNRSGQKKTNSEALKDRWKDPAFREMMLDARKKGKQT